MNNAALLVNWENILFCLAFLCSVTGYLQMVRRYQAFHALHADLAFLRYRDLQQYLGLQGYQERPGRDRTVDDWFSRAVKEIIQVWLLQSQGGHSQRHHQNQEIPYLLELLQDRQGRPHRGDRQHQSHRDLLLHHLCPRVRRDQGVQRLPAQGMGGI